MGQQRGVGASVSRTPRGFVRLGQRRLPPRRASARMRRRGWQMTSSKQRRRLLKLDPCLGLASAAARSESNACVRRKRVWKRKSLPPVLFVLVVGEFGSKVCRHPLSKAVARPKQRFFFGAWWLTGSGVCLAHGHERLSRGGARRGGVRKAAHEISDLRRRSCRPVNQYDMGLYPDRGPPLEQKPWHSVLHLSDQPS